MNASTLLALVGSFALAGSVVAQTGATAPKDGHDTKPAPAAATKNIVETAMGTGMHKTLCELLKEAGLVETLSDAKGKFTVFAPTDDAFKKVDAKAIEGLKKDKKALTAVLTLHVIKGAAVSSKEVVTMKESVATINGEKLKIEVKDGKVKIGNSKAMGEVIKADVTCSNGVIHVIDAVLMPVGEMKKDETAPKK